MPKPTKQPKLRGRPRMGRGLRVLMNSSVDERTLHYVLSRQRRYGSIGRVLDAMANYFLSHKIEPTA